MPAKEILQETAGSEHSEENAYEEEENLPLAGAGTEQVVQTELDEMGQALH